MIRTLDCWNPFVLYTPYILCILLLTDISIYSGPELLAFVANEIARHCKRPGSPIDDKMDICHYSSKRQRFM